MVWLPWPESIKKRACRYILQHYIGQFLHERIRLASLCCYSVNFCIQPEKTVFFDFMKLLTRNRTLLNIGTGDHRCKVQKLGTVLKSDYVYLTTSTRCSYKINLKILLSHSAYQPFEVCDLDFLNQFVELNNIYKL